ncbi:unnamed protein product [Trifolium pratense]|uniref:Uncharacterized protein n=1 Tax=Trifolium pratense TaxID=57577 RepID=A0ACB0IYY6_TRIPR|nr:unnamed protein product [Trifolium pratense]
MNRKDGVLHGVLVQPSDTSADILLEDKQQFKFGVVMTFHHLSIFNYYFIVF